MKNFLGTFFICLILCFVFTFFFAGLLMDNIGAIIFLAALLLAILITLFMHLDARIEALEKKTAHLQVENQSPPEE